MTSTSLMTLRLAVVPLLFLLVSVVHAEEPACTPRYPSPTAIAAMFDMAKEVTRQLDGLDDVDVVIAARGGQDLSRYGLRHSHLAFLLRNDDRSWDVLHLLNHCKSKYSDLYREGLVNFVGESSLTTDLRVGIPLAPVRATLRQLLAAPAARARALHNRHYSMVAYPQRDEYQNSNQWVLEVLAAAMAEAEHEPAIENREQAIDWLEKRSFQPSRLHIGLGKRIGARFFVDNVAVTDHPASERLSGNYSVVTVESVFDFMHQQNVLQQELSLAHQRALPDVLPAATAQP